MIFHLYRFLPTGEHPCHVACGLALQDVYQSLEEHLCTESRAEHGEWPRHEGDAVCIACIRRYRPIVAKAYMACRTIKAGQWAVLCECGGVRPARYVCGGKL